MVRMYQCSVTELGMYRTVMYTRLSVTIGRRIIYSMSFRLHNISVIRNDLYYHGNMNRIFLIGLMAYVGPVELNILMILGEQTSMPFLVTFPAIHSSYMYSYISFVVKYEIIQNLWLIV